MDKLKLIVESIKIKDWKQALKQCDEYELNNDQNVDIINNYKGVIHYLKKELSLAENYFLNSHNLNNKFEDPLKNLYLIYINKNLPEEALKIAKKLFEINSSNDLYSYQLAYAYELNNEESLALDLYKKSADLNGKSKFKALNNIGSIYLKNQRPKISLEYFLKAYELNKKDKIIVNNLLLNYLDLRNEKKSDEFFLIAQNIDNNYEDFILNKAEYLILKERYDDALKILLEYEDNIKFKIKLIILYSNMGKESEANSLLDNAREKLKNDRNFYNYISCRSLYEGNFEEGWKYYEYRGHKLLKVQESIKEWNGESLKDKNIVVFSDQGLGDIIQFSPYLLSLAKISKHVSFVVPDKIFNLFKNDLSKIKIETKNTIVNNVYDYKISLGSLIKFFYKEKSLSNENLIKIDQKNIDNWKGKLNTSKPNVGLVWSGSFNGPNQPFRSLPLKYFKKLLLLDVNFYCLQNEIWERDKNDFEEMNIINFGKYNLVEMASIIENLDLVISADTSILHLSAILNKETWGIFNIYPDWRWGEFYKINPYPSLKMIKQTKFNQWDDVIEYLNKNLQTKFKLNKV